MYLFVQGFTLHKFVLRAQDLQYQWWCSTDWFLLWRVFALQYGMMMQHNGNSVQEAAHMYK
jgi:hypothetical protein